MTVKQKRNLTITAGAALAALTVVVFIFILFLFRVSHHLVLNNDDCGTLLLKQRINEGDIFSVGYIHSVNKSPVMEFYEIRQGQIILTALEFETFGAGMPAYPEPGQILEYLPEGGFRISGFDRVMGEFCYIIGYDTKLTLYINERNVPLDSLDSAGQTVRFSIQKRR